MASNTEKVKLIFGVKLKQLRQEKGMQLNELAEKAGFSVSYLNEIEKGKKYPRADKIFGLARALETDYDALVSMRLSKKLEPIGELLNSNILQELPLELFGLEATDLLQLLSDAPAKVSSFINTIIEISRSHGMNVEQFYFSALRSYQEMHDSYFHELEIAAVEFLAKYKIKPGERLNANRLQSILQKEYGYEFEEFSNRANPELAGLRSVLIPASPDRLLLNSALEPEQLAFTLGREIGYRELGLSERSLISSVTEAESFEQVLNNFKASYFAGAILIPKIDLKKGLESFFSLPVWQPEALLDLMYSFKATPEVFMHRLSHLMTSHFGINQLFFLRFDNPRGQDEFFLSKELHLSRQHNLHAASHEHNCRRWVSITLLQELSRLQQNGTWNGRALCSSQVIEYMDTKDQYWILTIAKPSPPSGRNSSVTLGFAMDEKLKKLIPFLEEEPFAPRGVNETCERCGAADCLERAHAPVIWQNIQRNEALKKTILELKEGKRKPGKS